MQKELYLFHYKIELFMYSSAQPSSVGHVALVDLAAPSLLSFGDDESDDAGYATPPDSPITHIEDR